MPLSNMTGVFIKSKNLETDKHRENCLVNMKAKISQGTSKIVTKAIEARTEAWSRFSFIALRGTQPWSDVSKMTE